MFEIVFTNNKFDDEFVDKDILNNNMINLSLSEKEYIYGKNSNNIYDDLFISDKIKMQSLRDEYNGLNQKGKIELLSKLTSDERVEFFHNEEAENLYRNYKQKKLEFNKHFNFNQLEDKIEQEDKPNKPYNKSRNYGKNNYYKKSSLSNKPYKKSYCKASNTGFKPKVFVENIR
jgi:hypothetical protein